MPTLVSTVGGATSNTFASLDEANTYHDGRIPLDPPWVTSGDLAAQRLITATRIIETSFIGQRVLRQDAQGRRYYVITRKWTGAPASSTQALSWPRTGMFDRLGRAIAGTVNPQELKDAESELAGQLGAADRSLDNVAAITGVTSVKASSVAVTFKEDLGPSAGVQVLPDAVLALIPPSWYTEEKVDSISTLEFIPL